MERNTVKVVKCELVSVPTRKTKMECSLEINNIIITGVRLIERANKDFVISFPFWRDSNGGSHEYVYAKEDDLRNLIYETVMRVYQSSIPQSDPPVNFDSGVKDSPLDDASKNGLEYSLRDINKKLKRG